MKGKKVIIWGMGVSGKSCARFCHDRGASLVLVDRSLNPEIENFMSQYSDISFCEQLKAPQLENIDFIVLAPGISREIPELKAFYDQSCPILNEIELAYREWRELNPDGEIIALTGSNGKTTSVTMIAKLLQEYQRDVFLGGNIGVPFCEYFNQGLKAKIVVLELSSFQLESLFDFQANVRVLLNLTFTHGERYQNFESYAKAKFRLDQNPKGGDSFLLPDVPTDTFYKKWKQSLSTDFKVKTLPDYTVAAKSLEKIYQFDYFNLVGDHNLFNLYVCFEVLKSLGLDDKEVNQSFINSFQGIAHRLEVLKKNSSQWILNDAKSTNWDSTLSALKSLKNIPRPLYLILGGQKRGENDQIIHHWEEIQSLCEGVYLIGESGKLIADEIKNSLERHIPVEYYRDLKDLFKNKKEVLKKQSLLLSPAFPSFDQYRNYEERGEDFKRCVRDYLT